MLSMSINVTGGPQRRKCCFVLLVGSCFWLVPEFCSLLWVVPGRPAFYKRRLHRMCLVTCAQRFPVPSSSPPASYMQR